MISFIIGTWALRFELLEAFGLLLELAVVGCFFFDESLH